VTDTPCVITLFLELAQNFTPYHQKHGHLVEPCVQTSPNVF